MKFIILLDKFYINYKKVCTNGLNVWPGGWFVLYESIYSANISINDEYIANVKVDNNDVFKTNNYYICNRIIISNIRRISDLPDWNDERKQYELVADDGDAIRFIKNPTKEVQLKAIRQDVYALRHINNPPIEVQLEAVGIEHEALKFIKNPSKKVQLRAIEQYGRAITFIENPTLEFQLEAIKLSDDVINFIDNPLRKIKLEYAKISKFAIWYFIDSHDPNISLFLLRKNIKLESRDNSIQSLIETI